MECGMNVNPRPADRYRYRYRYIQTRSTQCSGFSKVHVEKVRDIRGHNH